MTDSKSISKRLKQLDIGVAHLVTQEGGPGLLPFSQTLVLFFLDERRGEETSIGQIEEHLGVTNPTVSGLVKRLLAGGLVSVETADDDKRRRLVTITEAGRTASHAAQKNMTHVDSRLLEGFTDDDKKQLWRLLDKLGANIHS